MNTEMAVVNPKSSTVEVIVNRQLFQLNVCNLLP